MPTVKTSTAFSARLICKYKKRRSTVNAMADGSRWSLNLSEIWTQAVMNGQRIFIYFSISFFGGMKRHAWLASRLDTKISLFSSQMVYKLWRIVQLVRCCFQLKLNNFPEAAFCWFFRQVFLFLILLLVTKVPIFYFNYSSMHTE